METAREALSGHLAALKAKGDGAFVRMIVPHRMSGERVHVDIAVDHGLLRRADTAAKAREMTRSAYFEAGLSTATEP